jgi:hypothetical protein
MCYVYSQWYDISCATLYIYIYIYILILTQFVPLCCDTLTAIDTLLSHTAN